MVPICVIEPMGLEIPFRTASTPATNVVATAPIPGIMMPSLPFAGATSSQLVLPLFFEQLLDMPGTSALASPKLQGCKIFRCNVMLLALQREPDLIWALSTCGRETAP